MALHKKVLRNALLVNALPSLWGITRISSSTWPSGAAQDGAIIKQTSHQSELWRWSTVIYLVSIRCSKRPQSWRLELFAQYRHIATADSYQHEASGQSRGVSTKGREARMTQEAWLTSLSYLDTKMVPLKVLQYQRFAWPWTLWRNWLGARGRDAPWQAKCKNWATFSRYFDIYYSFGFQWVAAFCVYWGVFVFLASLDIHDIRVRYHFLTFF